MHFLSFFHFFLINLYSVLAVEASETWLLSVFTLKFPGCKHFFQMYLAAHQHSVSSLWLQIQNSKH